MFLSLPVGIVDPSERLGELGRRMDGLKDTLEAPVAYGIVSTIGRLPQAMQDIVVDIFGLKGTAVMTNVMGPREQLYLAGAPLESLMFWVPQSGHLGLGVSILSYNGQVWMGTATDAGLVPDPDTIIDAFHAEYDELLEVAHRTQDAAELDETPEAEDLLPETEGVGAVDLKAEPPELCLALTKKGKRCKNRPQPGSDFCHVHRD